MTVVILRLLLVLTCSFSQILLCASKPFLIILDPAGHAKSTGRVLHQSYERAESLHCAQALKQALENHENLRVIITRTPGDAVGSLQAASFANRLSADLFIRIQLCKEGADKPQLTVYHLAYDPVVDFAKRVAQPLTFTPLHQAHYGALHTSVAYGNDLLKKLRGHSSFDVAGLYGLPLKSLVGITAPALLLEISVPTRDDQWHVLIEALAQGIREIVSTHG